DDGLVDLYSCADVQAASRLRHDEDSLIAANLARDHHLLLVAAGEGGSARRRAAAAHVELPQQPPRAGDQTGRKEPSPARVGGSAVILEREVLRQGELEHEAARLAILWNVSESLVEHLAGVCARQIAPGDLDAAGRRPAEPGD